MARRRSSYGSQPHSYYYGREQSDRRRVESPRGPPISMYNTYGIAGSSRRAAVHEEYGLPGSSRHQSTFADEVPLPGLSRSRSTHRHDEVPLFSNPFASGSSHPHYDGRAFGSSHHSRPGSRSYGYNEAPAFASRSRRGAADHSANAFDRYDPFYGQLGTGHTRDSVYGDPELPRYRSASEYARGSNALPPGYDIPSSGMRGSAGFPPPYSSFDSQSGHFREPTQYPPTRRPSHYDRGMSGLPPPDYFHRMR